mmetsp:Transcript_6519/g.18193  ORF Transcript_6519/g.18193 Transcript_6519/m.18193 type:complete len:610 (-) Transcript_6519:470-2299(-)|eukprot:CAMPEP_0117658972 /NCGR_PEP_ID=MMETSP0804-20121206/6166_1 /TAXON_ID=1074897 /ORGANISM="Tetraselmis astigmatica, Strain CCMP880" /LENGTH=609 /DNA_ID=CAMNT_0005465563 /DNA_START=235 /DNA_END=2064 /DNA_ORIENTATION=+
MLGGTVSAAVTSGFVTARELAEAYTSEYLELYANEIKYAKIGTAALLGATVYTVTVVTAYCTGEILGLPRGWLGLIFTTTAKAAVSRPALVVYATAGAAYGAAGNLYGFEKVNRVLRRTIYSLLPDTLHPSVGEELPIFAVLKGEQVWYEPQGGGDAVGPITIPGIDDKTEAAIEYGGTVFLISRDGQLSKPLLGRGPPLPDGLTKKMDWTSNSPEGQEAINRRMFPLYKLMDWSAQAVFTYKDRIHLVKDGLVWHDHVYGGDLQGPCQWSIMDANVQGAFVGDDRRLYVFKGGNVYHEAIGGGEIVGPDKWGIIDDKVQDVFTHNGRLYVIKNGELWHEKLGGGDLIGPEKRDYIDWAIQACWAMNGRVYFVKAGAIEHMLLPKGPDTKGAVMGPQHKSLALKPTDLVAKQNIQATWTIDNWLYTVAGGKVYGQEIGGGKKKGPETWAIADETVQAACVAAGRLYMIKGGGKVYHCTAGHSQTDNAVGPVTDWPLVDENVKFALMTTDRKLGVAQFVTAVGLPVYALNEQQTGSLLASIVLEETRAIEMAQQVAATSQANHLTGAMIAKYKILDFAEGLGVTPSLAKELAARIRHYCKNGVPESILSK